MRTARKEWSVASRCFELGQVTIVDSSLVQMKDRMPKDELVEIFQVANEGETAILKERASSVFPSPTPARRVKWRFRAISRLLDHHVAAYLVNGQACNEVQDVARVQCRRLVGRSRSSFATPRSSSQPRDDR